MTPATAAPAAATGGVDTSDLATLNDALGNAGIDLRVRSGTLLPSFYLANFELRHIAG